MNGTTVSGRALSNTSSAAKMAASPSRETCGNTKFGSSRRCSARIVRTSSAPVCGSCSTARARRNPGTCAIDWVDNTIRAATARTAASSLAMASASRCCPRGSLPSSARSATAPGVSGKESRADASAGALDWARRPRLRQGHDHQGNRRGNGHQPTTSRAARRTRSGRHDGRHYTVLACLPAFPNAASRRGRRDPAPRRIAARPVPHRRSPWRTTVGVVWHDEGAWTHNARNQALWGTWQTDNWNPLYIAPVFTGARIRRRLPRSASGCGRRALVPELLGVDRGGAARARRRPHRRTPGGPRRCGAPRHQLRRADVRPRGDHRGTDGGRDRRQLVGLRARAGSADAGALAAGDCGAGVLHQGGRRLLRRRARSDRARVARALPRDRARPGRRSRRPRAARAAGSALDACGARRRGRWSRSSPSSVRRGTSTASTTGRCR